jgi:hypothetical protein
MRYKEYDIRPRYWLNLVSKNPFTQGIRGIEATRNADAQNKKNHLWSDSMTDRGFNNDSQYHPGLVCNHEKAGLKEGTPPRYTPAMKSA